MCCKRGSGGGFCLGLEFVLKGFVDEGDFVGVNWGGKAEAGLLPKYYVGEEGYM